MHDQATGSTAEHVFADRMRREREKRGWSQAAMAGRLTEQGLALHPSAVTRIERSERGVSLDDAVVIAQVLGLTVSAMLDDPERSILELIRDLTYHAAAAHLAKGVADATLRAAFDQLKDYAGSDETLTAWRDELFRALETDDPQALRDWIDSRGERQETS